MLKKKASGFYVTLATLLFTVFGTIFFALLTNSAFESSENPVVIYTFAAVCCAASLITVVKDVCKLFSWAAFVSATITFFVFFSGRISYLAFFLSGDVMNTGLSPFFVLSCIAYFAAMVTSILAMTMSQEKQ